MKKILTPPWREYVIAAAVFIFLVFDFAVQRTELILLVIAFVGSLPTLLQAFRDLRKLRITIDVFNAIAIVIAFAANEIRSAAFIVLMLTFARLLDWYTETRMHNAVEELLKLKPATALLVVGDEFKEVNTESVNVGDVILVKSGARVPVDGIVISGEASLNESSVTGESAFVPKKAGDDVLGLTLNESGAIKVRATRVGKDSTSERMAELIREATKRKSSPEKIADKFAKIFLPVVGIVGVLTYLVTHNIQMTAAIFLVACADDMAVAIPLAMTAAFGGAARRGIIVKGGTSLDTLSKIKTLIFDKTGTLTYGELRVMDVAIEPGVRAALFWESVASGEKFSEHPLGKAIFHEALVHTKSALDPDDFKVHKGSGVWAKTRGNEVALGDESLFQELGIVLSAEVRRALTEKQTEDHATVILVYLNKKYAGSISVSDVPRREAKESIESLRALGIKKILMFTGDNQVVADRVAKELSIDEAHAAMLPEDKFSELEKLEREGLVGMVGDGVNDAPALSRADIAIAMGKGGAAVTVEAADIVILTDNLSKLPEAIVLARRTMSVIRIDMVIWFVTNLVGFALVFGGIAGPALAAFYNFATDFFPLLNSARLFRTVNAKPDL
jgi:Cd2+/Zn2+-exporting ATPase